MNRILILLLVFFTWKATFAQHNADAKSILEKMSIKYSQMSSLRAEITQNMFNESQRLDETVKGYIKVKGNKYVMFFPGQSVANDGERIYVFVKELNEITIDFFYPEESEINPANIFNIYKSGYNYSLLSEEIVSGFDCYVIDLIPEDRETQFYRIRQFIDKSDYILRKYILYDRTNTQFSHLLINQRSDINIKDSEFLFDADSHPGATIQDLTN